jgi:hypothetical protein
LITIPVVFTAISIPPKRWMVLPICWMAATVSLAVSPEKALL